MFIILSNFCNIVFKRLGLYLDDSLSKPLIQAVQNGHAACVNALLQAGANVDASNKDGLTALMYAASEGHEGCVNALLKAGVTVDASNTDGVTALMYAALEGHEGCVKALLQAGATVDADSSGMTALIQASEDGREACVNALLQAGATVDAAALMCAASNGHEGCVSLLLASGANVDAASFSGMTALMYAALEGHAACVSVLIAAGANVDCVNKEGSTALMSASSEDIRQILNQAKVIQTVMKATKDLGRVDALTLHSGGINDLALSQALVVSWRTEKFSYEFPLRHCPVEIQMILIKYFGSDIQYTIKAHQILSQHTLMKLLQHNICVEVNFKIQAQEKHCELPWSGLSDRQKEELMHGLHAHYSLSPLDSNQAQVLFLEKNILRNQAESYELHPSICTEGSESGHVLELLFALHPDRTQDPVEGGAQKVPGLLNLPKDILSQVVRQLNLSARDTIATIAILRRTCKALKGYFPPIDSVMIESNEADEGSAVTDSSQLTGGALPMASGSDDPPSEQYPRSSTLENGPSSLRLQLKADDF